MFRAGVHPPFNVTSEMQQDPAPVANGEQGNFDVGYVVVLGSVVVIVQKPILDVVDVLVVTVSAELFFR